MPQSCLVVSHQSNNANASKKPLCHRDQIANISHALVPSFRPDKTQPTPLKGLHGSQYSASSSYVNLFAPTAVLAQPAPQHTMAKKHRETPNSLAYYRSLSRPLLLRIVKAVVRYFPIAVPIRLCPRLSYSHRDPERGPNGVESDMCAEKRNITRNVP